MRTPPSFFKYPKTPSNDWNKLDLKYVYKWLMDQINQCGLKAAQSINDMARASRDEGNITKRGNIEGFRFLLAELHQYGYIDFLEDDNKKFIVVKRINENEKKQLLDALSAKIG
jgi:hypothetical protein